MSFINALITQEQLAEGTDNVDFLWISIFIEVFPATFFWG
jgi:hypothetical protein